MVDRADVDRTIEAADMAHGNLIAARSCFGLLSGQLEAKRAMQLRLLDARRFAQHTVSDIDRLLALSDTP